MGAKVRTSGDKMRCPREPAEFPLWRSFAEREAAHLEDVASLSGRAPELEFCVLLRVLLTQGPLALSGYRGFGA